MDDVKNKNKELEAFKQKNQIQKAASLFNKSEKINHVEFFHVEAPGADSDLRTLSDVFLQQKANGVLYIIKTEETKISFVLRAQKNTTFDFTKLAKKLSTLGARAGGKNDMIQGSFATDLNGKILTEVKNFLSESH